MNDSFQSYQNAHPSSNSTITCHVFQPFCGPAYCLFVLLLAKLQEKQNANSINLNKYIFSEIHRHTHTHSLRHTHIYIHSLILISSYLRYFMPWCEIFSSFDQFVPRKTYQKCCVQTSSTVDGRRTSQQSLNFPSSPSSCLCLWPLLGEVWESPWLCFRIKFSCLFAQIRSVGN